MPFDKGLNTDHHPRLQPPGTYRNAQNLTFNDEIGAVINEEGTASLTAALSTGHVIIGDVHINDNTIILFTTDGTDSIIWSIKDTVATFLLSDASWTTANKLDFPSTGQIQAEFAVNNRLQRVIYWTDNVNPPRFLNLDALASPTAELQKSSLELFPVVDGFPEIGLSSVNQQGGALKTGVYHFAVALVSEDGTVTNYMTVSNPITINDDTNVSAYDQYDGAVSDTDTTKSITVSVSNIDTTYQSIRTIIIKDGGASLVRLSDVSIPSSGTQAITYTGTETTVDATLDEVLINTASYLTARTMTQQDGVLYMGNLTRQADIGYQRYANAIKITPTTTSIADVYTGTSGNRAIGYKEESAAFNLKGFMRDEVYAFYISFLLKDGTESKAYHIPGRQGLDASGAGLATGSIQVTSDAPSAINNGSMDIQLTTAIPSQGAKASGSGYEYTSSTPLTGFRFVINVAYDGPVAGNVGPISLDGTVLTPNEIISDIVDELNADSGFNTQWLAILEPAGGPGSTDSFRIEAIANGTTYNSRTVFISDQADPWSTGSFSPLVTLRPSTTGGANDTDNATADSIVVTSPTNPDTNLTFTAMPGLSSRADTAQQYVDDLNANANFLLDYGATRVGINNDTIRITALTSSATYNGETATFTSNSGIGVSGSPATISNARANATDPIDTIRIDFAASFSVTTPAINGQDTAVTIANVINTALNGDATFAAEYSASVSGGDTVNIVALAAGASSNKAISFIGAAEIGFTVVVSGMSGGSTVAGADENEAYTAPDGQIFTEVGTFTQQKKFMFRSEPDGVCNMGYWENQNEQYPNTADFDVYEVVGGVGQIKTTGETTLQGTNVRHHHFPEFDTLPHFQGTDTSDDGSALGIDVTNVQIPDAIKELIVGWRIYYAKRNAQNARILDQCLLSHPTEESGPELRMARFMPESGVGYALASYAWEYDVLCLVPFSSMLNRPSVAGVTHVKMVCTHSITANPPASLVSYADPTSYGNPAITDDLVKSVGGASYVPNNTQLVDLDAIGITTDVTTHLSPSCIYAKLDQSSMTSIDYGGSFFGYHPYLVNLCQHKTDVYNSFNNQELVWTGYQQNDVNATSLTGVYGGDIFIAFYAHKRGNESGVALDDLMHYSVVETVDNPGLRHEGTGEGELYFPKSTVTEVVNFTLVDFSDQREADNYFAYNSFYSQQNDLKPPSIFDTNNTPFSQFPTRVIRSQQNTNLDGGDNFRRFLESDFKDIANNRGVIINLVSLNNVIVIHTERSLFRTRGREELVTQDFRAFLGAGDIFTNDPQEIYSVDGGFGGIQDAFTAVVTPYGYFFVDTEARKVFLFSDGLNEISSLGLRRYFEDNLAPTATGKLRAEYDPRLQRIILARIDDGNSWTLSYLPENSIWASFHSWRPDYLFADIRDLFSYKEDVFTVYKHGTGTRCIFHAGAVADSYIEFVSNEDPTVSKQVTHLKFQADLRDSSDVIINNEVPFTSFRITNNHQDTGTNSIIYHTSANGNARRQKETWRVNKIRDALATESNPDLLNRIDSLYNIVRLTFGNNNDKKLLLFEAGLQNKPSNR